MKNVAIVDYLVLRFSISVSIAVASWFEPCKGCFFSSPIQLTILYLSSASWMVTGTPKENLHIILKGAVIKGNVFPLPPIWALRWALITAYCDNP